MQFENLVNEGENQNEVVQNDQIECFSQVLKHILYFVRNLTKTNSPNNNKTPQPIYFSFEKYVTSQIVTRLGKVSCSFSSTELSLKSRTMHLFGK